MSLNTEEKVQKLININEVAQAIGLTKAGIFNLITQGKFPAGVKIGHSRRWSVLDVNEWINSRKENENICAN